MTTELRLKTKKVQQCSNIYGRCMVKGCRGRQLYDRTVVLGSFPKDPELQMKWLANLRLDPKMKLLPSAKVCSRHFERKYVGRRRLAKQAIPTLHLGYKEKPPYECNAEGIRMGRGCCIEGCSSYEDVWLLAFPQDEERRKLWMDVCNVPRTRPMPLYVCQKHFRKGDFLGRALQDTAVPTLHLAGDDPSADASSEESGSDDDDKLLQRICSHKGTDAFEVFIGRHLAPQDSEEAEEDEEEVRLRLRSEEVRRELIAQNEVVRNLANENEDLKAALEAMRVRAIFPATDASKHALQFVRMICSAPHKHFSSEDKSLAEAIHYISPEVYELMRDGLGFRMPHKASLWRWPKARETPTDNDE